DLAAELGYLRHGGVDVPDPEVDVPMRRWTVAVGAGWQHRGDDVAPDGLLGLSADIALDQPHHHLVLSHLEDLDAPAEDVAVEALRTLGVVGHQGAHRIGAGLVDELSALVLTWGPDPERGAGRIGDDRDPAAVKAVERVL